MSDILLRESAPVMSRACQWWATNDERILSKKKNEERMPARQQSKTRTVKKKKYSKRRCRSSGGSRHLPETTKLVIIVAPIGSSTLSRSPVDLPCPFHLVAFLSWRRRHAERRRPSPGLHRALRRRRASTRYSRPFPCATAVRNRAPQNVRSLYSDLAHLVQV